MKHPQAAGVLRLAAAAWETNPRLQSSATDHNLKVMPTASKRMGTESIQAVWCRSNPAVAASSAPGRRMYLLVCSALIDPHRPPAACPVARPKSRGPTTVAQPISRDQQAGPLRVVEHCCKLYWNVHFTHLATSQSCALACGSSPATWQRPPLRPHLARAPEAGSSPWGASAPGRLNMHTTSPWGAAVASQAGTQATQQAPHPRDTR